MDSTESTTGTDGKNLNIAELMDLRVDYAFKEFFAATDTSRLISLLNAIFEHKQIPRIVKALTIENPQQNKVSEEDKFSIIDIRAKLSDGTAVCIEMHLYKMNDHKYKSIRSLARVYSEELESGQEYSQQNPVIHISLTGGAVPDADGRPIEKVHSLFYLMERDDHTVLATDMELHFINMKAYTEEQNSTPSANWKRDSFTSWLRLLTHREIKDKEAFRKMLEEDEEMSDAAQGLSRLSQDKIQRQAYQRRLDQINTYNREMKEAESARQQSAEYRKQLKIESKRADDESKRADDESKRADDESKRADDESKRADDESKRADDYRAIISKAAKSMASQGQSIQDIASQMGIHEEEVTELLQA